MDPELHIFGNEPDREETYKRILTAVMEEKFRGAGYDFEPDPDSWHTTDLAKYDQTGVPHYRLQITVHGRAIGPPICDDTSYVFAVHANVSAEFLAPDYEDIETYELVRLGVATETDLESQLTSLISAIADDILRPGSCEEGIQTFQSQDGRSHAVVTPPEHYDFRGFLRNHPGPPPIISLYSVSRAGAPRQLTTFSLPSIPKQVLLSNDGRFLVTLASSLYSEHPVVIYRPDGSVVRGLSVSDLLTEEDVEIIRSRAGSIAWSDHFIDDDDGSLVLTVLPCAFMERDCKDRLTELRVDLNTGRLLQPKRNLVPRWEGRITLSPSHRPVQEGQESASVVSLCRPNWSARSFAFAKLVPIGELIPDAAIRMPDYTAIAVKARVAGSIELELLVSESGDVVCAEIVKGLSLGLNESVLNTALTWRLQSPRPFPTLAITQVTLNCEVAVVAPPS